MARPLLNSCCLCGSLRTGSLITGFLGIILSILTIIVIFVVRADFKTILLDWLPSWIVKIIFTVNLVMTILISILMIVGVYKRNFYLMLAWVVLGLTLAIGLLVSVIYTAVVCFIDDMVLAGVLWLVLGIISCIIYTYLWMVVYSHFTEIKEESDRGRYSKQPYRR